MSRGRIYVLGVALLVGSSFGGFAVTDSEAAAWLAEGWDYRMSLTAKPELIHGAETFVDIPLLLTLDGSLHPNVFAFAKADGSDLVVTAGDGTTVLEREIVGYDPVASTAEIWIRASTLSDAQNVFYLYYGNPDTTLAAKPVTSWSDDYVAVYHFADDPGGGVLRDSSPAAAHAFLDPIRGWTSSDVTNGKIHQAWEFNGTTHHLATRSISTSDSSYVISAWVNNAGPGVDFMFQCNPGYWHLSTQVNDAQQRPDYAASGKAVRWPPNPLPFDGEFHHFSWVFDGVADTIKFYFDGLPQPVTFVYPPAFGPFHTDLPINPLGRDPVGILGPMWYNPDDPMKGGADEFRVRAGTTSAAWIRTEFDNQSSPLQFYQFGPQETGGVTAVGPDASATRVFAQALPNPFRGATTVRFQLTAAGRVHLAVYDVAGREVARIEDGYLGPGLHERIWNGRTSAGGRAASGMYFVRLQTSDVSVATKVLLLH